MADAPRETWITGIGIVSCLGEGADAHWQGFSAPQINVDAKTFEGSDARITIVMAVADRAQMDRVIARVRKLEGVRDVERVLR